MTLQLGPEIEARLEQLAEESHVTAGFVAQQAILRFVEDREDYLAGVRALASAKYTISQEEMERRASVAD